jgi:ferric-dicitrate binding protein FerR (iron transport regulator)
MAFRKSKATKATKAKEAVTDPLKNQVSDRTDDLMAALEAAREALAKATNVASRKGAELGKEAGKAADKLLPERARQRRREAARRRNRRLLAGAAGLGALGLVLTRLSGPKGSELRKGLKRQTDKTGGWERAPEPASGTDPAASAEVTPLHGNGAGTDPARTPPS